MGGNVVYAVSGSAPLGSRLGHSPQPRSGGHPRGIRSHRDDGTRDGEPGGQVQDRDRRPCAPRVWACASPTTAEIEVRGINVFKGVLEQPPKRRRKPSARAAGSTPVTSAASTPRASSRSPDARRRSSSPPAVRRRSRSTRGPDPRQPDHRTGRRGGRPASVHLGARHPRPRDAPDRGSRTTASRRRCRSRTRPRTPLSAPGGAASGGHRERPRLACRVDPEVTILDSEWTEASGHLTPKLSIKRTRHHDDFADEIAAIYDEPVATTNVAIGG